MNLKELVELVSLKEVELDLVNREVSEMHIIPFLRHQSILAFRNGDRYNKQVLDLPKQSIAGLLKSFIPIRLKTNHFENTQVLFYDSHFKSVDIKRKKYNPFLDPFFEMYVNKGLLAKKTSFQWTDSFPKSEWTHPITNVEKDGWLPRFLRSYPMMKEECSIDLLISSWVKETGIEINKSHLLNAIFRATFAKNTFYKLLKVSKVDKVLFECYYKPEVFGLIAAARSLNIKTIDIQHGKQGTHHLMYTHWTASPCGGFNTVPDEFWNWGEESLENIRSTSSTEFLEHHEPVAVGFPWLDRCQEELPFDLNQDHSNFLQSIEEFNSRVLITLQPEMVDQEGAIPTQLLSTILSMENNIVWLIRMHPSMDHLPIRYNSLIDIDHVFIKIPTELPLSVLLNHSTHHITKFSSVAFEANAFKVPTLIIGSIGNSLFRRQFDQGVFSSDSRLSIREFVLNLNHQVKDSNYFARFNPEFIQSVNE